MSDEHDFCTIHASDEMPVFIRFVVFAGSRRSLPRCAPNAPRTAAVLHERRARLCCRTGTSPIEAALLVAALALPFHLAVQYSTKVIGSYRGRDIHERVAAPAYQVRSRELLLAPGLVYVTD